VRSDVERAVRLYEILLGALRLLGRGIRASDLSSVDMEYEVEDCGPRACADSFRRGIVLGIVEILSRVGSGPLFRGQPAESGEPPRGEAREGDGRALVKISEKRSSRSDRVRSRYQPEEIDVGLDAAPAWAWFCKGLELARLRVQVREDGEVDVVVVEDLREGARDWRSRGGRS
jgi:hypothetical protein